MQKKSIQILHPALCVGGAEKVLLTMLGLFDTERFAISLVLRNPSDWDKQIPPYVNVRYLFKTDPRKHRKLTYKLFKYSTIFLPRFILRGIFRLGRHDVVISFHEPVIFLLRATRGKKLAWIHGDYGIIEYPPEINELRNKKGILARLITRQRRELHRQCSSIVCVSGDALVSFESRFPETRGRSECVHNPQNSEEIRRMAEDVKPLDPIDCVTFCTVGRFSAEKAYERILNAANRLYGFGYRFRVIMVGNGPLQDSLLKLAQALGLEGTVQFVGRQDNPYAYLSQSDCLLISSEYEAFCTVACEALILGLPVLTTRCAGMEEILGYPNAGIITDNSEEGIFTVMKQVLDHPDLLSLLKSRAQERSNDFDTSSTMNKIYELFEDRTKQ